MAKLIYGDRIAKQAHIRVGCSAIIFDANQKVLLTQRTDNGRWCLPGGGMDPGESVEECCIRETLEETGLHVEVIRLIGVYSDPNMLIEYPDNRVQIVAMSFEAKVIGGALGLSDETTDYGYYSLDEMSAIDLMEHHRKRIGDALVKQAETFIY